MSEYISSHRIGDATVTVISDGVLPWALEMQVPESEWRRAMPEADAAGKVLLGINAAHIQLGDASILIDPGFDDPNAEKHEPQGLEWPGLVRSPGLHAALAQMGVEPEAITHVLITHAHGDHFAGVTVVRDGVRVPRYPNARLYIERADWEADPATLHAETSAAVQAHLGTLDRHGLLETFDGEREIVPGVTMIAAPGESAGHSIVRLKSNGQTFYYLGDLFHHRCEFEHLDWAPPDRDVAALVAARGRLTTDAVREEAVLVFTHEMFPAWGRVVQTPTGFGWERLDMR